MARSTERGARPACGPQTNSPAKRFRRLPQAPVPT